MSLLCRFLGVEDPACTTLLFKDYDVDFLITTLADPTDSGLHHIFDQHIAAIQRAAETADYILEGRYLPWPRSESGEKRGGETDTVESLQSDKAGLRVSESSPRLHEREPGIILFRGANSQKKLLLVFLVGETPTSGINKNALMKSLEAAQRLCVLGKVPRCAEYKLLAPAFSGSIDSLRIAIERWKKESNPESKFEIISGSATAIDKNNQLNLGGVKFSATVAHDDDTLRHFLCYLETKGVSSGKVAILSEGSTGYGVRERKGLIELPGQNSTPLRITYPLHISQLRKAAEKARAADKEPARETPSLRPRNLRLLLEEAEEPKDLIPPFSTFDTFSVELILSNLFTTISKRGIQYVGLFSTDIRDQIFLAREIKKRAPNVTLFTLGADLVYLHSDINLDFQGMLLISTYPLFSANQIWSYPFQGDRYRLQFPNDTAQGVYNAAMALLGQPDKMLEYGVPFKDYKLGTVRRPAIWLSVVGSDNIWPVAILEEDTNDYLNASTLQEGFKRPSGGFPWDELSPTWFRYTLGLVGGLTVLISLVLVAGCFPSRILTKDLPVAKWLRRGVGLVFRFFGDSDFYGFGFTRPLYVFVFSIGLLTVSFVVFRLLMRLSVPPPESHCGLAILLGSPYTVGILLPLLAAILAGMRMRVSARELNTPDKTYPWRFWASSVSIGLAPLLFFFLAGIFAYGICGTNRAAQFFLSVRMLNPSSGLSPLVPFVFVGVTGLLWILCSLKGLRSAEEVERMGCPFLNFKSESFAGLDLLESKVAHVLNCSFFELPAAFGVTLLIGIPAVVLFFGLVRSIEVSGFYSFFGVTFIIVYLALALTFLRFVSLWWATHRLLQHLSWHPLLKAFERLTSVWPAIPRVELFGSFKPFTGLEFSVDRARRLVLLARELPGRQNAAALETLVPIAEEFLNQALAAEAKGERRDALESRSKTSGALSKVSAEVALQLEPGWRLIPCTSWNMATEREKEWIAQGENFLATRAVAFLSYIFPQLQSLICSVMVGLLLMLLAVASYPFQPKDKLLWFNWLVIFSAVFLSLVIFIQMGRDRILSLLSKTTPGEVSWNREFILKILFYVLLPILALLGAQFPESLRGTLSWLTNLQGSP